MGAGPSGAQTPGATVWLARRRGFHHPRGRLESESAVRGSLTLDPKASSRDLNCRIITTTIDSPFCDRQEPPVVRGKAAGARLWQEPKVGALEGRSSLSSALRRGPRLSVAQKHVREKKTSARGTMKASRGQLKRFAWSSCLPWCDHGWQARSQSVSAN